MILLNGLKFGYCFVSFHLMRFIIEIEYSSLIFKLNTLYAYIYAHLSISTLVWASIILLICLSVCLYVPSSLSSNLPICLCIFSYILLPVSSSIHPPVLSAHLYVCSSVYPYYLFLPFLCLYKAICKSYPCTLKHSMQSWAKDGWSNHMPLCREPLLKGKAQYSWPPSTI